MMSMISEMDPKVTLAAIFFVFASLYSRKLIVVAACASIIYIYFTKPSRSVATTESLAEADVELMGLLARLKTSTEGIPYDYDSIHSKIMSFLEEYMYCFSSPIESRFNFDKLVLKRKEIVNDIFTLHVQGVEVPKPTIDGLSSCLFKYINALSLKYDYESVISSQASSTYPVALNSYSARDVF